MSIFQKSIQQDYINRLDKKAVAKAYKTFAAYFLEAKVQQNIRKSKEEQFQATFLSKLFVEVLGYTLFPDVKYNLTTEHKNEKGAQKADGAILSRSAKDATSEEFALAVIELKSTKTKDLESIRKQAFDYKANHSKCRYVVTSNFEKLRFYINDAVNWLEFDLFTLTLKDFSLLYLCLQKDYLLKDLPLQIKQESLIKEEQVTKSLYKDYSLFRMELYRDLLKTNHRNPVLKEFSEKSVKLTLFKKTQKLLDRFLFIFFAEDRRLIPPNMIVKINKEWQDLQKMRGSQSLYERYKIYFDDLNKGNHQQDIFAYNGGLFEADPILDNVTIDDALLHKHTAKLTAYDFESEVDVNILGHIFEHSLNEIESVNAEIEGVDFDKQKARRKKDGVFYTPKYITKYIVDNTLGKLCSDKRSALGIAENEYFKGRKGRNKKTIENLNNLLTEYREWLLSLTICDPACGSGAFLNQALEFLISEHREIDAYRAKLLEVPLAISDIENSILEHNLYGVDINQESVEIAKLSLWLRTAQRGRKLTSLNQNIKCGNSLIDSVKVAGDKAFKWEKEFPQVFKKGGFDVVIGNPPYVRAELLGDYLNYFRKNYKAYDPASDLFAYFYELGTLLIEKGNGVMGFISNTFDKTTAGKVLRQYLQKQTHIIDYVDFTEVQIFEGATTYPVIIILGKDGSDGGFSYTKVSKSEQGKVINVELLPSVSVEQKTLNSDSWSFLSSATVRLLTRLQKLPSVRKEFGKCYYGVKTALNDAFIVQEEWNLDEHIKTIYEGKELKKWNTPEPLQKLILFPSGWTKEKYGQEVSEETALEKLQNDFPSIMEHLLPFEEKGKKRYDKGEFWWELRNCAYYDLFEKPKIIFPNLQNSNKFCFDNRGVYINAPAVFLPSNSKTLLCVLNSKIVWEFLKSICVVRSGGYIEVKPQYFEQIPIPKFNKENEFEKQADEVIAATSNLQTLTSSLLDLLQSKFPVDKPSKKLQNWPELDFKGFLAELKKKKIKLSLEEEAEWMHYFKKKKAEANALQTEIDRIDKEIDQMVYELYGLSEEEIKIVEES